MNDNEFDITDEEANLYLNREIPREQIVEQTKDNKTVFHMVRVFDIEDRVNLGAAWLDLQTWGWFEQIDLNVLRCGDTLRGILAQVYGQAAEIISRWEWASSDAWLHGFDVPPDDPIVAQNVNGYEFSMRLEWAAMVWARRRLIESGGVPSDQDREEIQSEIMEQYNALHRRVARSG